MGPSLSLPGSHSLAVFGIELNIIALDLLWWFGPRMFDVREGGEAGGRGLNTDRFITVQFAGRFSRWLSFAEDNDGDVALTSACLSAVAAPSSYLPFGAS